MRDYVDTVTCKNGHKWDQFIIADPNGQDSLANEDERDCPECGMCVVDCDGCETCELSLASGERPHAEGGAEHLHGRPDDPARSPFEIHAFAVCDAFGKIAAENLRRQER